MNESKRLELQIRGAKYYLRSRLRCEREEGALMKFKGRELSVEDLLHDLSSILATRLQLKFIVS